MTFDRILGKASAQTFCVRVVCRWLPPIRYVFFVLPKLSIVVLEPRWLLLGVLLEDDEQDVTYLECELALGHHVVIATAYQDDKFLLS